MPARAAPTPPPATPQDLSSTCSTGADGRRAQSAAEDRAGHCAKTIRIPTNGDRRADRFPVAVRKTQEGVQAPADTPGQRRDAHPLPWRIGVEPRITEHLDRLVRRQLHPVHHRPILATPLERRHPLAQLLQQLAVTHLFAACRDGRGARNRERARGGTWILMCDSALIDDDVGQRPADRSRRSGARAARPAWRHRCRRRVRVTRRRAIGCPSPGGAPRCWVPATAPSRPEATRLSRRGANPSGPKSQPASTMLRSSSRASWVSSVTCPKS